VFSQPIRQKRARSKGFTLIEIMLVMLILSILAGAMVVNMQDGHAYVALESDAETLSAVIQATAVYARASHNVCRLVVDQEMREYRVESAAFIDQPFRPVGEIGVLRRLNNGIDFSDVRKLQPGALDHSRIYFFPDGRSEPAEITLLARNGERRLIRIGGLAGPPDVRKGASSSLD